MTDRMPVLYLSHGSPTLVIEECPARDFLEGLAGTLPRPRAIVVMSAHYEASRPSIGAASAPETIHDFRGFPDALYQLNYPAPGAPDLADEIAGLFREEGFDPVLEEGAGLDHGVWNPLLLVYPEADIPVVPLSILPDASPDTHARMGRALSPLRDNGVLLIGSGSITHNLRRFFGGSYELNGPEEPFARSFADWIAARVADGDTGQLMQPAEHWPGGRENHPTDDHIYPFYFAVGAAGLPFSGRRIHASTNYGVLAMDAFRFGDAPGRA